MDEVTQSQLELMRYGGTFYEPDAELAVIDARVRPLLDKLNATPASQGEERTAILKQALVRYEPGWWNSPTTFQYGHISIGPMCFINWECMFLDNAMITFGRRVAVAPRCMFLTSGHPLHWTERYATDEADEIIGTYTHSAPITVEDDVWIGAGVIVLGGVTIGARSVIGAGSVVTKSIPPESLAYGNPCRVVRLITEADRRGLRPQAHPARGL